LFKYEKITDAANDKKAIEIKRYKTIEDILQQNYKPNNLRVYHL